ncbi:MAG: shikimate kinase [Phycisphaeraceae bacterium]
MNVILIGYRGSGKTTIGRKLADQLWKEFADVDDAVRRRFGIDSIAEIWETHGEAAFREAEVETVRELLGRENHVIALGGGTVMQPGGREAVEQAADAKRIYLYCQPEELFARIEADAATATARPSLTAMGGGIEEIRAVLAERDPVYREVADAVFDVTHVSPDEAVRYLVAQYL